MKALGKYPTAVLDRHLDAVYVVARLRYRGITAGGTNSRNAVYLADSTRYSRQAVENNFHAEFSSILLRQNHDRFDEAAWRAANPAGFAYRGVGGVDAIRDNAASLRNEDGLLEQGFFHQYATSDIEDDFNAFAARLFLGDDTLWKSANTYPRIKAKTDLTIAFYNSIDPTFTREWFERLYTARRLVPYAPADRHP